MLGKSLPKMITDMPGPKSAAAQAERVKNVPQGISCSTPYYIARGEGAMVEDIDGNIMMDWAGGIGVLNIGYSQPEVVAAVKEQAEKFFHSSINVLQYESYVRLAKKLNEIIPIDGPKKTMFVSTGAEADENAIKMARKYTKKTDVLCFEGAFHGRTALTMALTSKPLYRMGFGPFPPGIHRLPYAYCYRCAYGLEYGSCKMRCLERIDEALHFVADPSELACIIVEPVQGEGGFVNAPKEFIQGIRDICTKNNIVFIMDEVQSGFCRTGKMFATEHYGVSPDIMTTAKSLAGGMPLSAVTARAEIADASHVGGLGGTYAGNPMALAAAEKIVEIMIRDNLAKRSAEMGEFISARIKKMAEKYPIIGDVRGLGCMIGIELVKDRATKAPAKEETAAICKEAHKNGLIIISTGSLGNNIRVLVPLVASNEQLEAGLSIFENAIKTVTGK